MVNAAQNKTANLIFPNKLRLFATVFNESFENTKIYNYGHIRHRQAAGKRRLGTDT